MSLVIERVVSPTTDAISLIDELESELSAVYSTEQRHGWNVQRLFQGGALFFVARLGGEPAGCGGLAVDGPDAEVKRMYVRPAARGRGVAVAMLERLEREARERGVTRLVLETGDRQQAAMRLYKRAGFTPCRAFGPYAAMSPREIEHSVFFEKHLR